MAKKRERDGETGEPDRKKSCREEALSEFDPEKPPPSGPDLGGDDPWLQEIRDSRAWPPAGTFDRANAPWLGEGVSIPPPGLLSTGAVPKLTKSETASFFGNRMKTRAFFASGGAIASRGESVCRLCPQPETEGLTWVLACKNNVEGARNFPPPGLDLKLNPEWLGDLELPSRDDYPPADVFKLLARGKGSIENRGAEGVVIMNRELRRFLTIYKDGGVSRGTLGKDFQETGPFTVSEPDGRVIRGFNKDGQEAGRFVAVAPNGVTTRGTWGGVLTTSEPNGITKYTRSGRLVIVFPGGLVRRAYRPTGPYTESDPERGVQRGRYSEDWTRYGPTVESHANGGVLRFSYDQSGDADGRAFTFTFPNGKTVSASGRPVPTMI